MAELGFWRNATADRERVVLVEADGGSHTAGELLDRSNQLVAGLRAAGMEPGDTLAVTLPSQVELIELYLAALQVGWRITPINHHLAGPEVAYIVNDSGARVFVGHERFADTDTAAAAQFENIDAGHRFAVGSVPGFGSFEELWRDQPTDPPEGRTTGAAMHYTSGTTGKPKGVKRTLFEIDPDDMGGLMTGVQSMFGIEPGGDACYLSGSPLYHTAPLMWLGSALHMGHRVVVMDKFDPIRMMELIDSEKVTWSHMVPTQFRRILEAIPPENRDDYDVASLGSMVHAAAPCPPEVKREMIEWWGDAIWEYYAATEGGGTIISAAEWLERPGSVGVPWPGSEVKILDDDHNELPVGTPGTVYMSLALADFEYKGDEAKTNANRWNGFFTVGDWGVLDEDGYLFLKDRKSDMIISGGVNIYPAEIEGEIITCPAVADVAVFGIPHDDWGEEIKAVVEKQDPTADDEAVRAEIDAHIAERLGRFKHPRSIDFVDTMPRDPSGKLFKRSLRDPYWEGRSASI